MRPLRDLPIQYKLTLLITLTSVLVLVLAGIGFATFDIIMLRTRMEQMLTIRANIMAGNSTAALTFDDPKAAKMTLETLKADPYLRSACIYTKAGAVFAAFVRDRETSAPPPRPGADGTRFVEDRLTVTQPILFGGERIGTVYLVQDLQELSARYEVFLTIGGMILLLGSLAAFGLSSLLQRAISNPIVALADMAKSISVKKDYTIRARQQTHDEIGLLVAAFNDMLHQIQERDATLRASEARMRRLVESDIMGIFFWKASGKIFDVNDVFLRVLGYDRKDLMAGNINWVELTPPEYRAKDIKILQAMQAAGGACLPYEKEYFRKDGSRIPVLIGGSLLEGKRDEGVGFALDISARKAVEVALRASEERLRLAVEIAQMGTWEWNVATNKVVAGGYLEEIYGLKRGEFDSFFDQSMARIHPEDRERILTSARQSATEGTVVPTEFRILRPDGEIRWVSAAGQSYRNEQGTVIRLIGVLQDVTERKRAEEEIRNLNAELEQRVVERTTQLQAANKELEAFSYSVSHDLRAPLRSIDGFSLAVMEDYASRLDEQGNSYLQRIRSATQRMGLLIDDMLNLSRVTRAEMNLAPVDLSVLANSVLADLKRTFPDRKVTVHITNGLTMRADARLLRILLENVFSNAWKFTSKNANALIELGSTQEDGKVVYFVRDNGAGFDMAYANKLFNPFQRLHSVSEFPGTGVGLATVHRVVNRHGGRIWAVGEVGKGATFYFTMG